MTEIAVFADVQNIYFTTRDIFGRSLDYKMLWQKLSNKGNIKYAYAYAIESFDEKQNRFQISLHKIGFNVKLKPLLKRRDGSLKADWDVGITIDILETARDVDTVVLVSGDGDFELLLKKVKRSFGVFTEVYGVARLTSPSLMRIADRFNPIEEGLLI